MNSWITDSETALAKRAAAFITATAYRAVADRGRFTLVLSGGKTPKRVYEQLALGLRKGLLEKSGYSRPLSLHYPAQGDEAITLPWAETFVFQGDERYVPTGHPDSNYGMVSRTLMVKGGVRKENLFRMPVESGEPEADALRYEEQIRAFFRKGLGAANSDFPSFDLVLLGLGDDGHTASLFPGERKALDERKRWVIAVDAPGANPPCSRLTLSLPVINHARSVMFLVPAGRYELARSIHDGNRPDLPAGMVNPLHGQARWFVAEPSPQLLHP
ncbi:MAG: 6-phosphogluconolactonase [Chlorobiaceae bacterium]|nr:6-phosphogluconolactonase [Chlorobiaceae bacterium]